MHILPIFQRTDRFGVRLAPKRIRQAVEVSNLIVTRVTVLSQGKSEGPLPRYISPSEISEIGGNREQE